jgi:diaminopimelate epimerase
MAEMKTPGPLPFVKMSGSGNDFIIIDNRHGIVGGRDRSALARRVCRRHTSVGADGLILIEESDRAAFRWDFYNADGSRADMCGNGGRCAARFAQMEGIVPAELSFETGAGIIAAEVAGTSVKIQLTRPGDYRENIVLDVEGMEYTASFVNTGVPHTVVMVNDVRLVDVPAKGRLIRYHPAFLPAGTNVNFVSVIGPGRLRVRTYERGVEGETLACGTGSVASALVAWKKGFTGAVTAVETAGGEVLTVHIEPDGGAGLPAVYLEGNTIVVCRGEIDPEGYSD